MTTITINHLARVEGHGGIHVEVGPNGVERCEMKIFEGSRFYEALLVGRRFEEVPGIICRVCAICSAGHTLCALGAVEEALGVEVSPETQAFRELLNLGQIIESHALHLFCLAIPDYLAYSGVLEMAQHHPTEVTRGLAVKRVGNRIQEVVGGRAIHPVNMRLGGLGRVPDPAALETLADELAAAREEALALERFILSLPVLPCHLEPAIYVALLPDGPGYALRGTQLAATGFDPIPVAAFRSRVNELVVAHATAKQSRYAKEPFMVGAVARLAHNGSLLGGVAAEVRDRLMPPHPTPLHNNPAQFVELVWALETAERLARRLMSAEEAAARAAKPAPRKEGGEGQAALEVPRGTLYHAYRIDGDGVIRDADIITPTAQNLANIEQDFRTAADCWLQHGEGDEAQLQHGLEMIARAYDPCISCATHLVDLRVRR